MQTHRNSAVLVAGVALMVAACGSNVTVQVLAEGADGPRPQANLAVQFLPFDRDSVFDALDTQASTARPEMSAELKAEAERVAELQSRWRAADSQWGEERDQLQQLSTRLDRMDRRDPAYRRLYEQFNRREATVNRLDRDRTDLFDEFTQAQEAVTQSIESFKIVRDMWEDETYAEYYEIKSKLLGGDDVRVDTTNTDGYATMKLPGGDWWITTRTPIAGGELYWNVRVDDRESVTLDESNGETRLRL